MPRTFVTDTINAANAGAVGQAMIERIRDELVAHAAWELVEEYTPASFCKWYVFKLLAASSGLPNDVFLIFQRVLGTGKLNAWMCEGYNSGTHVASLFSTSAAGQGSNTVIAYDANGRQTAYTYTLAITEPSGNQVPRDIDWTPTGVSTKFWLIIDDDGMSVAFNGAANGWMHFGIFDWLGSMANACPVHYMGISGGLYNSMMRNPAVAGGNFGGHALPLASNPAVSNPPPLFGIAGRLDFDDQLMNDQRPVAEIGMTTEAEFNSGASHVNAPGQIGWLVGKARHIRYGTNPPAGFAFGDAYVHNGTLWVPDAPNSGRIWDTGVAA